MLFLVTCLTDEGIYESSFIVVEAASELEVVEHILSDTQKWEWFLSRAFPQDWRDRRKFTGSLLDYIRKKPTMSPQELLDLIKITFVDGSSDWQMRIHPITVKSLQEVETDPG